MTNQSLSSTFERNIFFTKILANVSFMLLVFFFKFVYCSLCSFFIGNRSCERKGFVSRIKGVYYHDKPDTL